MRNIERMCEPRFNKVREAFAANFSRIGDVGTAIAIVLDGKVVVDLWGGFVDQQRTRRWCADTNVNVFSCEGLLATCFLQLVEEGLMSQQRTDRKSFFSVGSEFWPIARDGRSVGEVLRRVSGEWPGEYLRENLSTPPGIEFEMDLWTQNEIRVSAVIAPPPPRPGTANPLLAAMSDPESVTAKAISNPSTISEPGIADSDQWRRY
jgi:Beta-lactamase